MRTLLVYASLAIATQTIYSANAQGVFDRGGALSIDKPLNKGGSLSVDKPLDKGGGLSVDKPFDKGGGLSIYKPFDGHGEIDKLIAGLTLRPCALTFNTVVEGVGLYTGQRGFTAAGSERQFDDARNALIVTGLYTSGDLAGVSIRYCRLTGSGFTYDRDKVCLNSSVGNDPYTLAHTLAHEMFHVMQMRISGTDKFKCAYAQAAIKCGGCVDRRNALEIPAYEFEERAEPALNYYYHLWSGLFGSYTVVNNTPTPKCKTPGKASVTGLKLTDECGQVSPIEFLLDGRIKATALNMTGRPIKEQNQIVWDNSSIWTHATAVKSSAR